jgi:hypothetical protein
LALAEKEGTTSLTSKSVGFCPRADTRFGILGERFFVYIASAFIEFRRLTERDLAGAQVVDVTVD